MLLPELKYRVPLKPISRSPLFPRTRLRRERISWGSQRTGPLTTKGGSEDSGSSSSQSSIDLEGEDEDEKNLYDQASGGSQFKRAGESFFQYSNNVSSAEADTGGWHFNVQSRTRHVPPIHRISLGPDAEPKNKDGEHLSREKDRNSYCEDKANDMDYTKERVDSRGDTTRNERAIKPKSGGTNDECQTTEPKTEITCGATFNLNHDQVVAISRSEEISINDQQHVKLEDRSLEDLHAHNLIPCGNITLQTAEERTNITAATLSQSDINPKREERMLKALQPLRGKERRRSTACGPKANIPTNPQSFNILANKDQSIPNRNQSKSYLKSSLPSTRVKDKTRKSPELMINGDKSYTTVKAKPKSVKASQCGNNSQTPERSVTDHAQSKRSNPGTLGITRTQKHQEVKEQKGTQHLKRPGLTRMPRPQSAVDFVTYNDMFQQIQSGDKGPAIYEMFAGPVYDNLRGSSSCDKVKVRQVQSAKVTPMKKAQSRVRRSPEERTAASAKSKPKPASSRLSPHLRTVLKSDTHTKRSGIKRNAPTEVELTRSENVDSGHKIPEDAAEDRMLSTIEESLSGYRSETLKSEDKTPIGAAAPSNPEGSGHMHMQEINGSSSVLKQNQPAPLMFAQTSQQPKINTWTSSSSDSLSLVSPVYKKFLDEVGDGPFTDDLLQCLAEELISLDERDASLGPCPDMVEPSRDESDREDAPVPRYPEVRSLIKAFHKCVSIIRRVGLIVVFYWCSTLHT